MASNNISSINTSSNNISSNNITNVNYCNLYSFEKLDDNNSIKNCSELYKDLQEYLIYNSIQNEMLEELIEDLIYEVDDLPPPSLIISSPKNINRAVSISPAECNKFTNDELEYIKELKINQYSAFLNSNTNK